MLGPLSAFCPCVADLEQWYGETLIGYALGYLTVGHNGLSETELEDVLSCNDKVRRTGGRAVLQ